MVLQWMLTHGAAVDVVTVEDKAADRLATADRRLPQLSTLTVALSCCRNSSILKTARENMMATDLSGPHTPDEQAKTVNNPPENTAMRR